MLQSTNVLQAFALVTEHWAPKVIGRVNEQFIKAAKLKGQLVWHAHADEDELFQVIRGRLRIEFEGYSVDLNEGDFLTVPRGLMHNPVADEECWVVLIETTTTRHTGEAQTDKTRSLGYQLPDTKHKMPGGASRSAWPLAALSLTYDRTSKGNPRERTRPGCRRSLECLAATNSVVQIQVKDLKTASASS